MKKTVSTKKFICYAAQNNATEVEYNVHNNHSLGNVVKVYFPIEALFDGYISEGDSIAVIIMFEQEHENSISNARRIENTVKKICEERNASCKIEYVETSKEEGINEHLKTYSKLIKKIEDNDILYTCITFGTKVIPIIEMMVLSYAYHLKKNVTVAAIVYGKIFWRKSPEGKSIVDRGELYDVTALFDMNEMNNLLAKEKINNSTDIINRILNIGE